MDSNDNLLPYGFPIHGTIMGPPERCLSLLSTPKHPGYVARLYYDDIKQIRKIPRMIRGEAGTENSLVKDIRILISYQYDDEVAGSRSLSICILLQISEKKHCGSV